MEVVGGADRVAGEGDEEALTPTRHAGTGDRADRHVGEEVDGVLLARVALEAAAAGEGEEVRDRDRFLVADFRGQAPTKPVFSCLMRDLV